VPFEEGDICLNLLHDGLTIFELEKHQVLLLAQVEQVDVLEGARGLEIRVFDLTVDDGAFQVEDLLDELACLSGIRHQKDVYWCKILHQHREDSIDSGQQAVWVALQVFEVLW